MIVGADHARQSPRVAHNSGMTDKKPRKRAKALPAFSTPLTPGAIWNYGPGVVYDPTLPEPVRAAIPPEWAAVLDMPAFTAALGVALGHYRYYTALTGGGLSAKPARDATLQAAITLQDAFARLHQLPPLAKSLLDLRACTEPGNARSMLDRVLALDTVLMDLQWAAAEIDAHFMQPGRESSGLRDVLLTDVRDLILAHAQEKKTKLEATCLTQRLLRAARVPMPAKLDEIQRRIRAVEHKRRAEEEELRGTIDRMASRGKNLA